MLKRNKLELLGRDQERELLEGLIKNKADASEPIHILEAGCGQKWPLNLEGVRYVLTGIDLDREALNIRKNTLSDLDETIEGDLCSADLGVDRFDVIYCSFVLEHIKDADLVIKNFIRWTKPNGVIIIKIPDPNSVYGYITRNTPHWFHVFFYRFILKNKHAGKPGYAPYPTYYSPIISRDGMRDFCNDEANTITLDAEYGDGYFKPGKGSMKTLINVIKKFVNILSIGHLSDKHTNLLFILRKNNN